MKTQDKITLIFFTIFLLLLLMGLFIIKVHEIRIENKIDEMRKDLDNYVYQKPSIQKICDELDVDYDKMNEVIKCESRWNNDARGEAGEIGLAQWMPSTWEWLTKRYGLEHLSIYDEYDQLYLMAIAWSDGLQNHWTCYRNLYGYK